MGAKGFTGTLFLILLTCSAAALAEKSVKFVPGEILVKVNSDAFTSASTIKGLKITKYLDTLSGRFMVLKTDEKRSYSELVALSKNLADDPSVEYAEPNFIYEIVAPRKTLDDILNPIHIDHDLYTSMKTNDPKFKKLWGLVNTGKNEPRGRNGNSSRRGVAGSDLNMLNAWAITRGTRNIKIAVIDTGIDYKHPDLRANIWTNEAELNGRPGVDDDGNGYIDDIHGYDFANKDGDPMDGNGHGTHCAGTISAEHNNGIGIAGVMANAQIVGVKFLSDAGSGSAADALAAIDYATKIGVDIMSNSWGGGGFSQALKDAIKTASDAGIIFTAAAGNSGTDNDATAHYPSNYKLPNIISVAATNYNDQLASFSCYGANTVHVAGPGRNILSTIHKGRYSVYSGTSMATPHITGVVGLYLSQFGKTAPSKIRQKLMETSVYNASYGRKISSGGRVDAYNFLQGIIGPRPQRPNPREWIEKRVETFESNHPYRGGANYKKYFSIPGAKFVRLVIDKYETEATYDFLHVLDSKGTKMSKITGRGENLKTTYIEGDTIGLQFISDETVGKWGFRVTRIEYIR